MTTTRLNRTLGTALAIALLVSGAAAAQGPLATTDAGTTQIDWRPAVTHGLMLSVSGPDGYQLEKRIAAGETATFSVFDELGEHLPDGSYNYELRRVVELDKATREAMAKARESGDAAALLQKSGKIPAGPATQSGAFSILGGAIVMGGEEEPDAGPSGQPAPNQIAAKDQVINDDLIVSGSLCVGFDCVNGESFGFDTIRLKENNLRIKFDDTSTSGSFPNNDWQLTANDSANGGANKFSIDDITNSRVPFTIEASALNNSLYVDSGGRIGFGTSNPVVEAHVVSGDSPTLRLEQDGSSGFQPQTWDIAGNEANFFVRDVTNGSLLPFRVRPGAPTSSIDIAADGDVGIGTASPSASLHVAGSDGTTQILVEETSGTESARSMFGLSNNGVASFDITDASADGSTWSFETEGPSFRVNKNGTGGEELIVRDRFDASGNATLVVNGSVEATNVTFTSSRDYKTAFVPVDGRRILQKIVALPMAEWRFKDERNGRRHIGPVAEDFNAAFELGGSEKTISVIDTNGITMAAVQGLYRELLERDRQIEDLRASKEREIEALRARLEALEVRLADEVPAN